MHFFFNRNSVVLRNERTETGRRFLAARHTPEGDLIFEGHDVGEGVRAYWGYDEYEWTWTVEAANVPKLMRALNIKRGLLVAIKDQFHGPNAAYVQALLTRNAIPFVSWRRAAPLQP